MEREGEGEKGGRKKGGREEGREEKEINCMIAIIHYESSIRQGTEI